MEVTGQASAARQLAAIRARIDGGERGTALQALDALRAAHPHDDAIGLYWADLALRLKLGRHVPPLARAMRARAGDHFAAAKWAVMAGAAQMIEGDFDAACAAYADALAALAALGENAQVPPPVPVPATPAASPWDDMARVEQRLWDVLAGLKAAHLQAFPLFGTLLGLVRGGALLPFDKDLDLGVWIEDYRAVCAHLRALGMRAAPLTPPYDNFSTFIDPTTALVFDVTGLRREPEHPRVVSGAWLYGRPADHQRIGVLPWFTLVAQARPAGDIWWPDRPEAILEALYGDWRTPQPDWNSAISALNLHSGALPYRAYGYARLCALWMEGDIARTRRFLAPLLARLPDDALLRRCAGALDQLLAWMARA